jgi:hypothetical protein
MLKLSPPTEAGSKLQRERLLIWLSNVVQTIVCLGGLTHPLILDGLCLHVLSSFQRTTYEQSLDRSFLASPRLQGVFEEPSNPINQPLTRQPLFCFGAQFSLRPSLWRFPGLASQPSG